LQDMVLGAFAMGEFSTEGIMINIHENTLKFFEGRTKEDFIGKPIEVFFGEEEKNRIMSHLLNGKKYENVHNIPTGPGKTTLFNHKFFPICNTNGQLMRILMIAVLDKTEELLLMKEKLQEEVLSQQEEIHTQILKLNMTLEAAEIGLWDMLVEKGDPVNPNNAFTWSEAFRKLLGYSSEADFPNVLSSWSDKLHPEDKKTTIDAFAAHLTDRTGKTPYDLEYRLLKKNGEYGWYKAFGTTTRDENGYAITVAGGIRDITKEKEKI